MIDVVMIMGFLGSGKTTLLVKNTEKQRRTCRGHRQ